MSMSESNWEVSWVFPDLAISGRIHEGLERDLVQHYGISRVVDVRSEASDDAEVLRDCGVELLHLPTDDMCGIDSKALWIAIDWIREARRGGNRVLVHCEYGIGRSAVLVASVLVSDGYSPTEALRLLKTRRARVSPSPAQLQCFLRFPRDWCESAGCEYCDETWDEVAAVAYSPQKIDRA